MGLDTARIVAAEQVLVRRSLRTQFSIFGGRTDQVESIFVRLTDDTGCVGIGETTPMPAYSGVSVAATQRALAERLLPAVQSAPATPRGLHAAMDATDAADAALAKAAVDLAGFDLLGRRSGASAVDLLGGALRDEVPIAWVLGYLPIDTLLAEADRAVRAGYRTVKLKVGQDVEHDVAAVRAVRSAWPALTLRIDANQGYDLDAALAVARALETAAVELFEQPLPADRLADLAALRARTDIPIEADESLQSVADARRLVTAGACDVFNLKILKPGGLLRALQVVGIAESAGIPVMIGSMPELGVAAVAGVHLARTLPSLPFACELMGPLMVHTDVLTASTVAFQPGVARVERDAPGLGLTTELPWPR